MHHTHTHTHFQWSRNSRGNKPPGRSRHRCEIIPHLTTYCSVYSCCYATIARTKIRCLVTLGKHVKNTRAVARQLLGERVPEATDTHATVEVLLDYNNGNGQSSSGVDSCRLSVWVEGIGKSSARATVTRGPREGSWRISTVRRRSQGTAD
jgi:hypothetical protein